MATKPDPQEQKTIAPLTSTEELLEALDLVIGSEGDDLDGREYRESKSVSTQGETSGGGEALVTTPTRRRRKSKKEIQAAVAGEATYEEPSS